MSKQLRELAIIYSILVILGVCEAGLIYSIWTMNSGAARAERTQ